MDTNQKSPEDRYPYKDESISVWHASIAAWEQDEAGQNACELRKLIVSTRPESREKSLALTHLDTAILWLRQASVFNDGFIAS